MKKKVKVIFFYNFYGIFRMWGINNNNIGSSDESVFGVVVLGWW